MISLKRFLDDATPFSWQKQSRIYIPQEDGFTHGSHPCIVHLRDDLFLIAFTRRDENRQSHIYLSYAEVLNGNVTLLTEPKHALSPGEPCTFDCEGVISVCFVQHKQNIYLYYVGWQNLPEGRWICDTGRAIVDSNELTLTREFTGPILGRDKNNPLFAAATAFWVEDNQWQTWYNSGISWQKTDTGWKHYYGIHYAHSQDGINWTCEPGLCLPFADEYEYAFGRPTVIKQDGIYYMWYAHRATQYIDTYRIGFAYSLDGRTWIRKDELAGITVANDGWDNDMICYPCVFMHRDQWYMLYNGNGYGQTGFGLATLEEPK